MAHHPASETAKSKWKSIIQECRNYVPVIEGEEHLGSGLLVSSDGQIITNAHVVEGSGTLFTSLFDGTRAKAATVHRHPKSDLAIVKASIHTERFFEFKMRSVTDGCEAGDEALAIGHPRGLSFTATTGIVSESQRVLPDGTFVQTDVAINPGNSGGPLFDVFGKLIGINTQGMIDSQGLGFAIPANQVLKYWLEFRSKCKSGEIILPTDEELSQLEQTLSPRQVLEAAAELAEIKIEKMQNVGELLSWQALTPSGDSFNVGINNQTFLVHRYIGDFEYLPDSQLLYQILRWQDDMTGLIHFRISDSNDLTLGGIREFENLDVSEAAMALLRMAEAVDYYASDLEDLLDDDDL